jgi:hypothetical protein
VAHNLYLVFSSPPPGVSAQDYDRWYDKHVRENIVSPGFVSGRRYEVEAARDEPGGFTHLALYEYDGDIGIWRSDLDARLARKEIDLPDWFPQIHFGSWSARPLTDRIVPVR